MASSRGKRRGQHEDEHEEHVNHEAWVIPYADVLTLLMALFLVLWAIGPDEEKLELAADSFRRELDRGESVFDLGLGSGGTGGLTGGGTSVLDGAGPAAIRSDDPTEAPSPTLPLDESIGPTKVVIIPGAAPDPPPGADLDADDGVGQPAEIDEMDDEVDDVLGDPLAEVELAVRSRAAGSGLADAVRFRRETRGLVVTIVTDQVLFEEGRAEIQPDGVRILDIVGDALVTVPNAVTIEGHTDSRPISTATFPSNWELSTARATSVLRYLTEERGFQPDRISAAGYADTRPLSDGGTPASMAKNRRVEIVVLATAVST